MSTTITTTKITLSEHLAHAERSLEIMRSLYTQEECLRLSVTPTIAELEDAVTAFRAAAVWDANGAEYAGNGADGVSYRATQTPVGWYLSAVVDSKTGSVASTLVTGDGPFASETDALLAGYELAATWCRENHVPFNGFDPAPGED